MLRGLATWGVHVNTFTELLETDCPELYAAVHEPVPEHPSITWCVRRFLMHYPSEWRTSLAARGKCGVVSQDFVSFMRHHGAGDGEVVMEYLGDPRWATQDFLIEVHEVVKVGRIRIDFTRRQFDSEAPIPTAWICTQPSENVFPPRATAPAYV